MVMNTSLEVESGGPLDSRDVVDSLTDLTDAASFPYFYEGMAVYVKSEKNTYALVGDDPTVIANWQEIGGSGETVDQTYDQTSTNAQSGIAVAEAVAGIATLETKIAALEAKLANFEEFRLQMTDGTNTVDKVVLAKPYVEESTLNMFALKQGVYDANGNLLGPLRVTTDSNVIDNGDHAAFSSVEDWFGVIIGDYIHEVSIENIKRDYPDAAGLVFDYCGHIGENVFYDATSGCLDWIVLYNAYNKNLSYMPKQLFGNVKDAIGTVYTKNTNGYEPWYSYITINTTGTPLAWNDPRTKIKSMFDLKEGAYDVDGNFVCELWQMGLSTTESNGDGTYYNYESIDASSIDPNIRGIVFPNSSAFLGWGGPIIDNATDNLLDWVVIPENDYTSEGEHTPYTYDITYNPNSIGIIYYNPDFELPNAPWGQTGATFNSTGKPVAWRDPRTKIKSMFDLKEGAYDADGNRLGYLSEWRYQDEGDEPPEDNMIYLDENDPWSINYIDFEHILQVYPDVKGLVICANYIGSGGILGMSSKSLDWLVITSPRYRYDDGDTLNSVSISDIPDSIGTIYIYDDGNSTSSAPWGMTSTINTAGTPLVWKQGG